MALSSLLGGVLLKGKVCSLVSVLLLEGTSEVGLRSVFYK